MSGLSETLSGERVCWEVSSPGRESRSTYSTMRLLVQPVAEAQGKGGVVADGLALVKVYPLGVEQECGE